MKNHPADCLCQPCLDANTEKIRRKVDEMKIPELGRAASGSPPRAASGLIHEVKEFCHWVGILDRRPVAHAYLVPFRDKFMAALEAAQRPGEASEPEQVPTLAPQSNVGTPAPNPLRWTREKPTAEGWYFWSHPGQRYNQAVDLFKIKEGKVQWYSNYRGAWVNVHKDLEFAGPIPEPSPESKGAGA